MNPTKWLVVVTVIAAFATSAIHAQQPATGAPPAKGAGSAAPTAKKLSRAEFDALLGQPEKVLIVDVRRPDELQSIGGFAAYLSIQASELEKSLAFIPKDRQIVTVSNHAARASRAAAQLEKAGFQVAGAIGAQDYEAAGGTLVKIAPPPPRATAQP